MPIAKIRFAAILLVTGFAFAFASVMLGQLDETSAAPRKNLSAGGRYPLPKEGLVPDKETAIKVAEAVLFRLYGEDTIANQRPYVVKEDDFIWWISGTLPRGQFGIAFNIGIAKHTAAVVHLTLGE